MNTRELATKINSLSTDKIKEIMQILNREKNNLSYCENPNFTTLLSLQYAGETQTVTESSLNRIIYTHMNKTGKELNSWAIITVNKKRSQCPPYEEISNNSKLEKRKQFEQRITNKGYSHIHIFGGFFECSIPGVSIENCPKDKYIDLNEKTFFIPKITFEDISDLSQQLYKDLDWNNNKTEKECGRFAQDCFIYAGKETKYDAHLCDGKTGKKSEKIAKVIPMKKGMYGYTVVKHKYFTLEAFAVDWQDRRSKKIFENLMADTTKYSHYLVYKMLQLSLKDKKKLLTLLK